ncbi:MAG: YidC/Oxa1 family membrane protein insertase [Eubacteriales bacterium]|nr:YidC/Oxa1 family membrane protein insertase [Eubacteriales bacterium]
MNYLVSLGILDPLYQGFGWLLAYLYSWMQNYGLVIIFFNLAIRLLTMPLNFKTQRGMARQLFLRDDINEIKRYYANDPQKAREEQMALMQRHGMSMAGGSCFLQLIQFVILIAFWRPIRSPLFYIAGVSAENLTNIGNYLMSEGALTEKALAQIGNQDVILLSALRENQSALAASIEKGWIRLDQVLDLKFMGMDLGKTPSFKPSLIFGADTRATYLPLLILVIVMIVTMILSMRLARVNMPSFAKSKEEQERDKKNPAKQAQLEEDQTARMNKSMNIFMPLMMLYTAFVIPAAMAMAWLVSNLVAILQAALTYVYYTKPAREIYEERKLEKQIPRRRKA